MENKLDKRIFTLKEIIEQEEKSIKKAKKFQPITNCMWFYETPFNLNTMEINTLELLLIKVRTMLDTANKLKINPQVEGYSLKDWVSDIKSKIDSLKIIHRKRELILHKTKLTSLLSEQAKVSSALDDIEANLKQQP